MFEAFKTGSKRDGSNSSATRRREKQSKGDRTVADEFIVMAVVSCQSRLMVYSDRRDYTAGRFVMEMYTLPTPKWTSWCFKQFWFI